MRCVEEGEREKEGERGREREEARRGRDRRRERSRLSLRSLSLLTCSLTTHSLPLDHRSAHGFSKAAYERGVVIVTCASCSSRHLLSDRLGWFGAAGAVDKFLAERGSSIREGAVAPGGTLEVSAEDLDGWTATPVGTKES